MQTVYFLVIIRYDRLILDKSTLNTAFNTCVIVSRIYSSLYCFKFEQLHHHIKILTDTTGIYCIGGFRG